MKIKILLLTLLLIPLFSTVSIADSFSYGISIEPIYFNGASSESISIKLNSTYLDGKEIHLYKGTDNYGKQSFFLIAVSPNDLYLSTNPSVIGGSQGTHYYVTTSRSSGTGVLSYYGGGISAFPFSFGNYTHTNFGVYVPPPDPYEGYDSFIKTTDLNPLLNYTNNTDYPITIELFSDGQSNITISSPSKWAGTNDIGTSKIPFELLPLETFTVFKNSGDPINIGIKPQSEYAPIELPNEYLYITSPPEGKQTTDKWMTYNIMYSIQASEIDDVQINIRDINGSPFTQNSQIKTFESLNHNAMVVNGYVRGSLQVFVDYNSSFTGFIGTKVKIINTVTKKELSLTRNVEIVPFLDSNSDGIDDNTGETQFGQDEFITITSPNLSSTTSTRLIPLDVWVKIIGNDFSKIITRISYLNTATGQFETLIDSDLLEDWNHDNINQFKVLNNYKVGEYIRLHYTINLLFKEGVTGDIKLMLHATSDTTGKTIKSYYTVKLLEFVDVNNDGIDDNTGEEYNPNPELPDYSDNDVSLDGAIGVMKDVIPSLTTGLTTISNLIGVIFGWLPSPIQALMLTIITLIGITTLVKVIRG